MTQYNMLNIKWSNSQLSKLKSGMKNGTEVTSKLYQIWSKIPMMKLIFHIDYY